MQAILWSILLVLIKWALGVSTEFLSAALKAVIAAQGLKHEDGTSYTGTEKRKYVVDQLKAVCQNISHKMDWDSTINLIVEFLVAYSKGTKKI